MCKNCDDKEPDQTELNYNITQHIEPTIDPEKLKEAFDRQVEMYKIVSRVNNKSR